MQPRKIPERHCVGCGAGRPKKELVRVVRSPQGEISLDATGKKPGRGAYLCPDPACLAKAKKAHRLENALGVAIPQQVYERLTEETLCAQAAAKEAEHGSQ